MKHPAAGFVALRLGVAQRSLLALHGDHVPETHRPQFRDLLEDVATGSDEVVIPFTAAGSLAGVVSRQNTTWNGEHRAKEPTRLAQLLTEAVAGYAKHPAFRTQTTGAVGIHINLMLPLWAGHWWPIKGAERTVLAPKVRKWNGTDFTIWSAREPLVRQSSYPERHSLEPDFDLLESFAIQYGQPPEPKDPIQR